ncbi:MAG: DUF1844 domain-containing protein [Candidatus Omnitrophica bacterium]|nr:DUF1844 domain-containing protein [Candidatus Omnitrophota bacterium]
MKEQDKNDIWQVNFTNFINGLGLECLVGLGKLENPLTKKKEFNHQQAKYIIDILDMIKEKTAGNLNQEEQKAVEELTAYLKMLYVENQGQGVRVEGQESRVKGQEEEKKEEKENK